MMSLRRGAAIHIERDTELLERVLDDLVIAVHDVLRGDSLLASLDGNGHTMLVATADHQHLTPLQAQIACIDIGRYVYPRQVADVHRAVGVWQGGGDECSFEIFHYLFVDFCVVLFINKMKPG